MATMITVWLEKEDVLFDVVILHDGKRYVLLDRVLKAFTDLKLEVKNAVSEQKTRSVAPANAIGKVVLSLTDEQEKTLNLIRAYLGGASLGDALKEFVAVLEEDGFFGRSVKDETASFPFKEEFKPLNENCSTSEPFYAKTATILGPDIKIPCKRGRKKKFGI